MSTFAELSQRDARGLVWLVDVSLDDFSTVAYRWATHAGSIGGNQYEERISGMGNIQRELGANHLPVANTLSLQLRNTDFGVDFLVARATVESSVFRARFKVSCGLFDDDANTYQATVVTQQIGIFVCLDFPVRTPESIELSLADDALGKLNDLLVPPSLQEWMDSSVGVGDAASPFGNVAGGVTPLVDFQVPVPLQFGPPSFIGAPMCTFDFTRLPADFKTGDFGSGRRKYIYPIIVLATRDTDAVAAAEVGVLRAQFRTDITAERADMRGAIVQIPQTFSDSGTTRRLWKHYRTGAITKDGYDWQLLWIALDVEAYSVWFSFPKLITSQGVSVQTRDIIPQAYDFTVTPAGGVRGRGSNPLDSYFSAFERFIIGGTPGSGINGKTIVNERGNAVYVLKDLVEHYSSMGAAGVDSTRFGRALLVNTIYVKGAVSSGDNEAYAKDQQLSSTAAPFGIGTLRKTIAAIAATADIDLFITMEGKVGIVSQTASFETQTMTATELSEARISNVSDKTPSTGERWSPYNRVFVRWPDGVQRGPYDNGNAITAWQRIISKVIDGSWWAELVRDSWQLPATLTNNGYLWNKRNLEAKARPVIRFTTDLSILGLDLGDFFKLSWTRGGSSAAYSLALWRLEGVTIRPMDGRVDVVAVWMGDIETDNPFLLDNESFILRTSPALGQTLTVTDGSLVVTRSAGSFITDGVSAGDILRIRDTSEAATTFYRNRDIRIASRDSATQLTLTTTDTDFGTAGAHVIADADWFVLRGATTYHTAISDPTNYPSGGAMYGKATDVNGEFSDTTTGNKLLFG